MSANPDPEVVRQWGSDELLTFLKSKQAHNMSFDDSDLQMIRNNKIVGQTFLEMDIKMFRAIGLVYGPAFELAEIIIPDIKAPRAKHSLQDSSNITSLRKKRLRSKQRLQKPLKSALAPTVKDKNISDTPKRLSILDGHDLDNICPVVSIYHQAFGRFLQEFADVDAAITPRQRRDAEELVLLASRLHLSEDKRDTLFTALKLTLGDFIHQVDPYQTLAKKVWEVETIRNGVAAMATVEVSNGIGEGASDAATYLYLSYKQTWAQKHTRMLRLCCCCPSFLIAISGTHIMVLGAVSIDSTWVEPLTAYIPFGFGPGDEEQLQRLARLLRALEIGMNDLFTFYQTLDTTPTIHTSWPYIREYQYKGAVVRFQYCDKLLFMSTKLIWFAITDNGQRIAVKFVRRYNGAAHRLLAAQRLAPELFYDGTEHPCDPPLGEWNMIVMAFVSESPWSESAVGEICRGVKEAVDILHQNNLVFGDLRAPNVLVVKEDEGYRGMLVDFDWSGEHRVARYPETPNPKVKWPPGVEKDALLDKDHDNVMMKWLPDELLKSLHQTGDPR